MARSPHTAHSAPARRDRRGRLTLYAWSLGVAWTALTLAAAWCCARWGTRNVSCARAARSRPPLEPAEVTAGNRPASSAPASWPAPATMTEVTLAAAYRDYARERRETRVLWGELIVLASSAALGASVPGLLRGGWETWPFAGALLAGAFGVALKRSAEQKWTRVAVLYARRVTALRHPAPAPAEPLPSPPATPWWRRAQRRLIQGAGASAP
jgi:hypothetical protein